MKQAKLKDFTIMGDVLQIFARVGAHGKTAYELRIVGGEDELLDNATAEELIEKLAAIKTDIEDAFGLVPNYEKFGEGYRFTGYELTNHHILEMEMQNHDEA